MKPILFSESRTRAQGFNTFGEAVLSDVISCVVTEELNGEFEMEMVYPISGFRFAKIQPRSIILVGTTPRDNSGYNVQPFRVYSIVKNSDGTATILARHLSYDLNGIPVTTLFGSNGVGITLSQLCTYLTTYFHERLPVFYGLYRQLDICHGRHNVNSCADWYGDRDVWRRRGV